MPEVTAAELRRLRTLETRVVTVNETLEELRTKRKELQAELTATRRELRAMQGTASGTAKQVEELIAENSRLAGDLDRARADLDTIGDGAAKLRASNDKLKVSLEKAAAANKKATAEAKKAVQAQKRLEKQLATVSEQLEGDEPPEVTPDQLSELLGSFIDRVSGRTGLAIKGTNVNLRIGFSGRGGGSFVVPSVGVDASKLPELHDVQFDLIRRPADGVRSAEE